METQQTNIPNEQLPTYSIGKPIEIPVQAEEAVGQTHADNLAVEPAGTEVTEARNPRVAIYAIHGMGQQIPFQILDQVTAGICRVQQIQQSALATRSVKLGDQHMQRVELTIEVDGPAVDAAGTHKRAIDLHIYEGYWAPITEGNVTIVDVFRFMLDAGLRGVRKRGTEYSRFLFQQWKGFKIPDRTRIYLLAALAVLLALALLNLITSVVVGSFVLPSTLNVEWQLSVGFVTSLTLWVGIYSIFSGILGGGLLLLYTRRERLCQRAFWPWINRSFWWLFAIWVGATILMGLVAVGLVVREYLCGEDCVAEPATSLTMGWTIAVWAVWLVLLVLSRQVQKILVQTMGDVVIYVDSFKVDRFLDLRLRIKKWLRTQIEMIYTARETTKPGAPFYYDKVAFLGHSLGSVIAYDMLNALLNDDDARPVNSKLDVVGRTSVLCTAASPLDKIAYIFSLQDGQTSHTREALATTVQPLIQDYRRYRQMKWVNVYAERDIIGHALNFFDHERAQGYSDRSKVDNVLDREVQIPLIAHIEVWQTRAMFVELCKYLY